MLRTVLVFRYGNYSALSKLCTRNIDNRDAILVIGCGNSDFSADFYDVGYTNITNVDFSENVIRTMAIRNALRDKMSWRVMDMTSLVGIPDSSFDVVFDKGALDALMSESTDEVRSSATSMFAEISRVLKPGGKYICVSLAEAYIVYHLLKHFIEEKWEILVDVVSECGGPSVPLIPFFFTITKPAGSATRSEDTSTTIVHANTPVHVGFNSFGERTKRSTVLLANDALEQIRRVQSFQQRRHDISSIRVGRFDAIDIWADDKTNSTIPKYTLTVLDVKMAAPRSCAVFFVPLGREADYQFTSQQGLSDIAAQAATRRLIAVRCNRPHVFGAMADIQAELSPICASLAPLDKPASETIPFMAIGGESRWDAIYTDASSASGDFVVEECDTGEEVGSSALGSVYRRLVFLRNQQFIQTEVRLLAVKSGSKKRGSKNKKKAISADVSGTVSESDGSKALQHVTEAVASASISLSTPSASPSTVAVISTTASDDDTSLLSFDYSYLDAHHRAILVALALLQEVSNNCSSTSTAATAATTTTTPPNISRGLGSGVLVGLGGGALSMAIRRYFPSTHLTVAEIDDKMLYVAQRYFGYKIHQLTTEHCGDGLAYIHRIAEAVISASAHDVSLISSQKVDYVILDADSSDPSLGLSAPPKEFATVESIRCMHSILQDECGMLIINTVARDPVELSAFKARIADAFGVSSNNATSAGALFELKPSDDTFNITLIAVKNASKYVAPDVSPSSGSASAKGKKKASSSSTSSATGVSRLAEIALRKLVGNVRL